MTLHWIYRSYGGENDKNRPYYYSKILTLTSFVQATTQLGDTDVLFLNDGPVPADRLAIMERYGRVVQLADKAQGMRASYRAALTMAAEQSWPNDDVVSFVEDDYLFTQGAFLALAAACERLPQASYLSLYGDRPDYDRADVRIEHSLPRGWTPAPDVVVGDDVWFNRASIASTFTARLGALRADLPIFFACMRPFRKRYLDHETCLLYQGYVPYHGTELLLGLPDDFVWSVRGALRTVVLIPFRVALNQLARRQPRRRHLLYTLVPNQATHVEHPVISPDQDWAAVAGEVAKWAAENGLPNSATAIQDSLTRAT